MLQTTICNITEGVAKGITQVHFRAGLILLALIWRLAMIVVLICTNTIDMAYFTYISYVSCTILLTVLLGGLFRLAIFRFYVILLLPPVVCTTTFVSITVALLVDVNSAIFTDHFATSPAGMVYVGDLMVHHLPAYESLIIFAFIHKFSSVLIRDFMYTKCDAVMRVCYSIYFIFSAALPVGIYGIFADWKHNYPTDLAPGLSWSVVMAVAGLVGVIFYLAMVIPSDSADVYFVVEQANHAYVGTVSMCRTFFSIADEQSFQKIEIITSESDCKKIC